MVRLLALLDKLDLDQVQRTGERARKGLEALAREYREILKNVRGVGVMLAFDVLRPDWRDALRDRAFRRGLVLLPAGERVLRFYPRYDTEPSAIDEALAILRLAIEDIVGGRVAADATPVLEVRVGRLAIPLDTIELVDLTPAAFETHKLQILAVEQERYGTAAVNSLLLRTLPVKDPARLALMTDSVRNRLRPWTYPVWDQIRQRPELFDATAAWSFTQFNLARSGETQFIDGLWASGSFFETLGAIMPASAAPCLARSELSRRQRTQRQTSGMITTIRFVRVSMTMKSSPAK